MKDDNTMQIRENLVRNLARIFTEYGWIGKGAPESFGRKIDIIADGLTNGDALSYATHLKLLIQARKKDHKWGLYTPVFVEGVLNLLNAFAGKHNLFERKPLLADIGYFQGLPEYNIFKTFDYAKKSIERLEKYGKTNIRFSLIEDYGEERVLRDLRRLYPKVTLFVDYDSHQPDQIRDWLYDGGVTKMTVMYPIMPLVIISIND